MTHLPGFTEIPRSKVKDLDEFLTLLLLPQDEIALRKAAMEQFVREVDDNNRPGDSAKSPAAAARELAEIADIRALTPGGVAWKIAKALSYWEEDDRWEWWRHMLKAALCDAIELERMREAGKAPESLPASRAA